MSTEITIVIVPRDHFYHAPLSLETVIKFTSLPYDLIYVDHSSPKNVQLFLQQSSVQYGFRLLRSEVSLSPNEARNLAIPEVKTPFIVFIDNDLLVTLSWLEPLVEAAKTYDAWIVSPTYLIGPLEREKIHMSGGEICFVEEKGNRLYRELHLHMNEPLSKVKGQLCPGPTDFGEFHCILVRTEVFERVGLLDEKLFSHGEHLDLCMAVKQLGGMIYYEPRSIVTYLIPEELPQEEVPYYFLRWGNNWNRYSIQHFCEKWHISPNDPYESHVFQYLTLTRRRALRRVAWPWGRILELLLYRSGLGKLVNFLISYLESNLVRDLETQRLLKLGSELRYLQNDKNSGGNSN